MPDEVLLPIGKRLKIGVDVYQDYPEFLAKVALWIHEQKFPPNSKSKSLAKAPCKRKSLACEAVRAASDVWVGVGVYTVSEIWVFIQSLRYSILQVILYCFRASILYLSFLLHRPLSFPP
jgi:hypothetical protein